MLSEKERVLLEMRNERMIEQRDEETRLLKRWELNWEIMSRLRSVGVLPVWRDMHHMLRYGPEILVDTSDLPRLRDVFPRVKDSGRYEVRDADERVVKVFLDLGLGIFERSDWMYFIRPYYLKTLPENSRCKIELITEHKHEVICGVN